MICTALCAVMICQACGLDKKRSNFCLPKVTSFLARSKGEVASARSAGYSEQNEAQRSTEARVRNGTRENVGNRKRNAHFSERETLLGEKSFRVRILNKEKHKKSTILRPYSFYVWPARRDSNPRSSESESAALSNCATSGNVIIITDALYHFLCIPSS